MNRSQDNLHRLFLADLQEHPMPPEVVEALREKLSQLFKDKKPNPFSAPP